MAIPRMDLSAFVGKLLEEQKGDVLREGVRVLARALMEAEVTDLVGADRYERTEARRAYRNGSRTRAWDTRVGTLELAVPKVRPGSYYPSLLQPWRRAEQALRAVVQEAYVHGRVDAEGRRAGESLGPRRDLEVAGVADVSGTRCHRRAVPHPAAHGRVSLPVGGCDVSQGGVDGRVVSQATAVAVGVTPRGRTARARR